MFDLQQMCFQVCEVAKEAGKFIRHERTVFSFENVEHKGHNDFVSYVDKTAEAIIVLELKKLIPDSGFITEENTELAKDSSLQWIIDPLDGTTNFIHGLPCYCVSIALMLNGKTILGVVYEINLDECFYAWEGSSAYLNDRVIKISSNSTVSNSLFATGFPYTNYTRMEPYMNVFNHLMHQSHGLRRLGSAAADLAYVACGRLDGFYEYGLNSWDVAAGAFIVQQAGGLISDFGSSNNYIFGREIVATNGHIHKEFMQVINKYF
jgi:myo-inositol-1(or 4)-monophosphatase